MATVKIGGRWVGDGEPCFMIAEAGSNHDGKLEQAIRLIDVAASAGADAVKFQLFRADKLYTRNAGQSGYLNSAKPIYDIVNALEMPYEWLPKLMDYCRTKGLLFLSSVFDEDSADRLAPYVECFKIASYEMTHIPLIRYVGQKGKPVIISTGTADLDEIDGTVKEFNTTGNNDLILMQCTAAYPAPLESLNVRAIATMKSKFGLPVGLSDHSIDPTLAPLIAVAVGANLIEKHFTLSRKLPGPDHRFAIEPDELHTMIRKVRNAELALGSGEKKMHSVESELRRFARRTIIAIRDIDAGEMFTKENIGVLRPGVLPMGLPPKAYLTVLGRRAKKQILANSTIYQTDIA